MSHASIRAVALATGCLGLMALAACSSGSGSGQDGPAQTGTASAASTSDGGGAPVANTPSASGDTLVGPCKTCHGADLAGASTPLPGYAAGVSLFAPNLTPDKETGIGTWTTSQLRVAIRDGLDKEGMILCPQMKHYPTMSVADLDAIIATLRAQPAVKKVVAASVCPPLKR